MNLGPVQPIEAIRLLLALFLAGYFARRWELLRGVRGQSFRRLPVPAWLNLPRGEYILPVFVGVGTALLFFFVQKDLGPALVSLLCVPGGLCRCAGTDRHGGFGLALLVAGFYVGYRLQISATLADRVRMWQSPWDNTVARWQSNHTRDLGDGDRWRIRHRPGSRQFPLSAGRAHRPDPCRHR